MNKQNSLRRVLFAVFILFLVTAIGVVGFMYFENDNFLDALYMTTITITTVGYGLPHELSENGKIFTIFLIFFSFINYAYAISIITTYLVEGRIRSTFGMRSKYIEKNMKKHVIICGFGRNGRQVAKELEAREIDFVVIDNEAEVMEDWEEQVYFVNGDATEDKTLKQAGILTASAIVSTMPDDADNLFVALSARELNPKINIVCRSSSASSEKKMHIAGVDHVVMPESVGGSHMAMLATRKDVVDFLDHLSVTGDSETNLEVIEYDELPFEFRDKTIMEMSVRTLTGGNIVGFKTSEGEFIINPSPETRMEKNSKMFILCTKEQAEKLRMKK